MRAFVLAAALVLATPAAAEPPVWIVSDQDSEVVLFGSIHVLPPDLDWRPAALSEALRAADDLWFELPMDRAGQLLVAQLAQSRGTLPPGQSLFALLPPRDAARLRAVAAEYGVSEALIDRLQPWMAEVALTGAVFARAGAGTESGVELAVQAEAPASARRRAFETPQEQIELLAGASFDQQIASLRQSMDEMADGPEVFSRMVRAWAAGDLKALERDSVAPLRRAAPALFRRLVTERNLRWTAMLDERLKGQGRTVVVVGMGHLVGKDGVPARLKVLGYKVKGP